MCSVLTYPLFLTSVTDCLPLVDRNILYFLSQNQVCFSFKGHAENKPGSFVSIKLAQIWKKNKQKTNK